MTKFVPGDDFRKMKDAPKEHEVTPEKGKAAYRKRQIELQREQLELENETDWLK